MRRWLILLCVIVIVMGTAGAACAPLPPPPAQRPASVFVGGDSITWTAWLDGAFADTGWLVSSYMGWQASHVIPSYDDAIANSKADHAAFLLGANDITGGWTSSDENTWNSMLARKGPSCIVLVLPWFTEAQSPEVRAEIDKARAYMVKVAPVIDAKVVDWKTYVEANPTIVAPDGVHLATPAVPGPGEQYTTKAAQAARRQAIEDGLAQCSTGNSAFYAKATSGR